MIQTEDRTFTDEAGTVTAKSTQLPALQAFKLLSRLSKTMGPAIGAIRGAKFNEPGVAGPAIALLLQNLEPEDVESLSLQVLSNTMVIVDGKPIALNSADNINRAFMGRLLTLFKVMSFAIEVNYRDFFRGLAPAKGQDSESSEKQTSPSP